MDRLARQAGAAPLSRRQNELHQALMADLRPLLAAGLFSALANLLVLTGPLFLMQVHDRVLTTGSVETLVLLALLAAVLYAAMIALDHARGRVMARIGARLQARLEPRVLSATLERAAHRPMGTPPPAGPADLEAVQRFLTYPVASALMDLPFTPLFLLPLYLFHPVLGAGATVAGGLLLALALSNHLAARAPLGRAAEALAGETLLSDRITAEADSIIALGMQRNVLARWQASRRALALATLAMSDRSGFHAALARGIRQALQTALLATAAWLVIRGEIGAGAMFAASILMGRALAPLEHAIAGWAVVERAAQGWARLTQLLLQVPPEPVRTALPPPRASLVVRDLTVIPPGAQRPVLHNLSFRLSPGQALGVIGPSGAGKTTLVRTLTGLWPPSAGSVRLGGGTLAQYGPGGLADLVGHLPQRVALFPGTVAENIARLAPEPEARMVTIAARRAGAHEMILSLPNGYDTRLTETADPLSGGQAQRVALARALYGEPLLLILDEPNASLDAEGTRALNAAIRGMKAQGASVVVTAHRPAVIGECDFVLILEEGRVRAFGPRDEVLSAHVANASEIMGLRDAGSAA